MYFQHYSHITIVVLIAATFSAVDVFGQTEQVKKNSLTKNCWAVQFGIENDFQLSSFQEATVSVKRQFEGGYAIRFGLSGTLDSRGDEYAQFDSTGPLPGAMRGSYNSQYVSIASQYLSYSNPDGDFNFFWGAGPKISFERFKSNSSSETTKQTGWWFGGTAVLGVEWFAAESFSIHAEYSASLMYATSKRTTEFLTSSNGSYSERKTTTWRFAADCVVFGVSVYL